MKTKGGILGLVILVVLLLVVITFFSVSISPKTDEEILEDMSTSGEDLVDLRHDAEDTVDRVIHQVDDSVPDYDPDIFDDFVDKDVPISPETLTVANWNLQIFGESKASNAPLMEIYPDVLDDFDIAIVQEIRDSTGDAFRELCSLMPTHQCLVSERAGRSTSKEQYGVIYNSEVEVLDTTDLWLQNDKWERPPLIVEFKAGDWIFSLVTIHTKPDDVSSEMTYLEGLTTQIGGDVIVLGDLNADCRYYDTPPSHFTNWNWIIPDSADTTTSATDCAYDRIITNFDQLLGYDVDCYGTHASDHCLVWAEFIK